MQFALDKSIIYIKLRMGQTIKNHTYKSSSCPSFGLDDLDKAVVMSSCNLPKKRNFWAMI
ncbi:hypothetical protein [Moraxella lacunata]|uniref:hypothetical protein n=1 Tax=Moraxella lacunata TaxID=477 RepID=UPI003EE09E31